MRPHLFAATLFLASALAAVPPMANGAALVIKNDSAQRLFVQLESIPKEVPMEAKSKEALEQRMEVEPYIVSCTVPPHGVNELKLDGDDRVNLTIRWFALENRLAYEYHADNVDLMTLINYSKNRPTSERIEFRQTATRRGEGGAWKTIAEEQRWRLGLWCTGTPREALLNFRQLAIGDPSHKIPSRARFKSLVRYW